MFHWYLSTYLDLWDATIFIYLSYTINLEITELLVMSWEKCQWYEIKTICRRGVHLLTILPSKGSMQKKNGSGLVLHPDKLMTATSLQRLDRKTLCKVMTSQRPLRYVERSKLKKIRRYDFLYNTQNELESYTSENRWDDFFSKGQGRGKSDSPLCWKSLSGKF